MYKSNNPYRSIETEVLETIEETPTIRTIRLKPKEEITFETGQFIELTIPGTGEAPFTPSSNPRTRDTIEVSVMKVGKVTEQIHRLGSGDTVGLRGPFGTGYPFDKLKGQERTDMVEEVKRHNSELSFPTIVIDDQTVIVGFKQERLEEELGL